MEQLDLFDLVDAENFTIVIYYTDGRGVRHSTQLGTSKTKLNEALLKWREEHQDFYFLYYEKRGTT